MRYNLSEARILINSYKSKNKLSNNEGKQLEGIVQSFDLIESRTAALLYPHHNDPKYFANNSTEVIVEDFSKNAKAARLACRDALINLKSEIDNFKKSSLNKDFSSLLTQIQEHIQGVLLCASQNYSVYDEDIYKICRALGGFFIPSSQSIDPLMGIEKDSNDNWMGNSGECYGLSKQQISEIKDFGAPLSSPMVKEHVTHYQDGQPNLVAAFLEGAKAFIDRRAILSLGKKNAVYHFIDEVLINLKPGIVCKTHFFAKKIVHGMYFRRIPVTTYVEYFDPNYGRFYFKNDKQFKYFYIYLISVYRRIGLDIKILNFIPEIEQDPNKIDNTHIVFPLGAERIDKNDVCLITDKFFNSISNLILMGFSSDKIRIFYHDAFSSLIQSVDTIPVLDAFLEIINKVPEFQVDSKNSEELLSLQKEIALKRDVLTSTSNASSQVLLATQGDLKKSPATKFTSTPYSFFPIMDGNNILEKERIKANNFLDILSNIIKDNFDDVRIEGKPSPIPRPDGFRSLSNYINDGKKLFNETFNQELAEAYFEKLLKLINETRKFLSSSLSYAPQHKSIADTVLIQFSQQVTSYRIDLHKLLIMNNYDLLTLDTAKRVEADKKYIEAILAKMSGWIKLHEAVPGISALPIGGDLKLLEKLKQIKDKNYVDYHELENDVHQVNREVQFKFGELAGLLDDFFQKHLKLSNYNRENGKLKYEEPTIQKEKLEEVGSGLAPFF